MRTGHRSARTSGVVAAAVLTLGASAPASAGLGAAASPGRASYTPGSAGVGDPYFPLEGNGGYDVAHYDLRLSYHPATHHLGGSTTITAAARKNLSRFDLDLTGYRVSAVTVDGAAARFTRSGQELVVTPAHGLDRGSGVHDGGLRRGGRRPSSGRPSSSGAVRLEVHPDGAFVGGSRTPARKRYPSNDHPSDKASFRFA